MRGRVQLFNRPGFRYHSYYKHHVSHITMISSETMVIISFNWHIELVSGLK